MNSDELSSIEKKTLKEAENEIHHLKPHSLYVIFGKLNLLSQVQHSIQARSAYRSAEPLISNIESRRTWLFTFTSQFEKGLSKIGDKKKEGRILEAIRKISKNPLHSSGNTQKPLTKELKGKWRYRIGKYRLIYYPDIENQVVHLLFIGARENIYD